MLIFCVVYMKYLIQINVYQYCLLFKRKLQDNMHVNDYRWFRMLEQKEYNVQLIIPDEEHHKV